MITLEIDNINIEKPITITNRGMITIPAQIRKRFDLKDGDRVVIVEDEAPRGVPSPFDQD